MLCSFGFIRMEAFFVMFYFFIIGSHFLFNSVRDSSRAILIFDEIVLVELKEENC